MCDLSKPNYRSTESSESEDVSDTTTRASTAESNSQLGPKAMFNEMESGMINIIIEEATYKLIVINRDGDKTSAPIVRKPPMHVRFDPAYKNQLLSENMVVDLAMGKMILVKLQNDISNLRKLLSDTHTEMAEFGTFETLQTFMDNDIQSEQEELILIRDSILNDKKLKILQTQLEGVNRECKKVLKQLDDEIFDLETRLKDARIENDIKTKLVQQWERTRHEQARIIIQGKENDLVRTATQTKANIERELRLKSEIDGKVYINYCIDQISEKIAFWTDKYQREIKALDAQIAEHKDKIVNLKVQFEEMTILFKHREKDLKICAEFMKEREQQLAFANKQMRSAIKIQAWWRGTMVRKGLGQFKRKKKQKPQKAPKKGKKGK
ncbi:dynein regulatory complex protein 9-like isoform X1 [Anopheles stephensi]|uniref:dynein regulatory complex protein 9-like isoform X1 n=1 Tax=Anopheles stephensi TaxID=30069 RepID=UPI00165889A2|nr:dynein regulatory complex protein 9-like isoform X1 [Anopheles stephensi]